MVDFLAVDVGAVGALSIDDLDISRIEGDDVQIAMVARDISVGAVVGKSNIALLFAADRVVTRSVEGVFAALQGAGCNRENNLRVHG